MKEFLMTICVLMLTLTAGAQTLNVNTGNVTYQFPAEQTGDMTFSDGTTLTVMGKEFTLSDIDCITLDDTEVTDNVVTIAYNTTDGARVTVPGNVARYVVPVVSGNHVTVSQLNTEAASGDEITYQLSGTATDGSLTLDGSYKCTVALAGVTLTNPNGAAININNSKRIQLSAKSGTVNTLTDGNGSQKACVYSKGQLQLQGNGTLYVAGKLKHGIKSASYIVVKNLTLNITSAVGDGISCEEYFWQKSGNITISGTGDDGIQCDLGGTTSTGETTDHEDEDSGSAYLEGGTLNITVTAAAAKGIKCDGNLNITDGTVMVKSTATAVWDSEDAEVKGSTCLSSDGNIIVSGGTLLLDNSGAGGKAIKADGMLTVSGSVDITATASGLIAYCSSTTNTTIRTASSSSTTERLSDALATSPKAIRADGGITVSGGSVWAKSAYHEGIESKTTLTITGGYVYAEAKDDAMNSAGDFTVNGGYVFGNSSGNDGLDANGNFYIKGGNVVAVAASQPEVGIDANTEGGKQLYITGGNIVAIGGLERGSSITGGTAKQTTSYTKGAWYGLTNGSEKAFAFKVPSNSSMGSTMVVFTSGTPALSKSVTTAGTGFWNGNGYTSFSGGSSVNLSTYNSSSGGGGGHGPGW